MLRAAALKLTARDSEHARIRTVSGLRRVLAR